MRYLVPSCNTDGMAALIRGKLELRGACLYIVSGEGRYPVLWPYGTQWDKVNNTVVARDGTIIPLGREVAGAGGFLHVGDVQRLADDRAAALASQCAVGGTGEIAVLNNDDNDFVTTLG